MSHTHAPVNSASPEGPSHKGSRGIITAWASWDWASAAINAVMTTFVFSVYLTSDAFGPDASAKWSFTLAAAGFVVALLAPVTGQRADLGGTRVRSLRLFTLATAGVLAAMFLVRPDPAHLPLGLALAAIGTIFFELSTVNYNAMLPEIAPAERMGRISGLGWGAGYVGGIVLLLILYVGFIQPDVGLFGVTGAGGLDVRVSMVLCAVWTLVFSAPLLLMARENTVRRAGPHPSIGESYRNLGRTLTRLWREDRRTLKFLVASAIFRDGLAGVFGFAGVLAAGTFGFTGGQVIVFAIVANVVAGLVTIASGRFDDALGPRRVILVSLPIMVALGIAILALHGLGPRVFWVCGLALAAFVGPVQSASRTFLGRLIPPGSEGEVYGLYATTGRAVSFLAPVLFGLSIAGAQGLLGLSAPDAQIYGILGIVAILALGFVLMLAVPGDGHAIRGTTAQRLDG